MTFRASASMVSLWKNFQRSSGVIICLTAIILGATYLRFFNLSTQPYWMDEGYTINAVLSLAEHGTTVLDSGQYYSCPTYCYPTMLAAEHFGQTAFSYRLVAAISGVVFVGVIFFISANIFESPLVGLGTAFFTTFSTYEIAWSRQARWYTLYELFFWIAIFAFYKTLYSSRARIIWALVTALSTLLASATQNSGYLLPIIFFAWIVIEEIFIKRRFNLRLTLFGFAASIGLITLFELLIRPGFTVMLIDNISVHYELPYYASFYLRSYWLLIIYAVIAAWNTKEPRRLRATLFLLFVLASYVVPLSFLTGLVYYRYLFHLTPIIFILASLGITDITLLFKNMWQRILIVTLAALLFFASGIGVYAPRVIYMLESDNPATIGSRPYFAYTPQPDWNGAYAYIAAHRAPDDIVISSMPQFNKIFLGEPGYWIQYSYTGLGNPSSFVHNGHEYYVNAAVIPDLPSLQKIIKESHGFIVYDYMATDGRIAPEILAFIDTDATQAFYEKTNAYSQVWVYRF